MPVAALADQQVGRCRQRKPEPLLELLAGDLENAELLQMVVGELCVEKPEAAGAQARHKMHKRDLGGVGPAREHRFAENAERSATP